MPKQPLSRLDPSIVEFYDRTPEEDRLNQGPFLLEGVRTRELIERHAPRPPATVLDVGGAGGVYALFAAAISRWASALDGLSRDLLQDPRFAAIVEQDLREGQHRNPTERLDYFTTAYFHRPDELGAEVVSAGLMLDGLYGVEGPGWFLSDVTAQVADPRRRAELLQVARLLESEPSVLGVSAHLLAVARAPA